MFARCKVIVFLTKNPRPILPYLQELDKRGIHLHTGKLPDPDLFGRILDIPADRKDLKDKG